MHRRRATTAFVLFAIALFTRLPLRMDGFWSHDSVLYARAVEDGFDPPAHRPQPPGYLYYVLLARAVSALTADPNDALTLISVVAAAAAVALLYLLAARLYDDGTAAVAALFLLTSVTFWGESLVALPYTLLGALTIVIALLLWRVVGADRTAVTAAKRGRRLALASLAWGVAVGFRSELAMLLVPVWLLAALTATRAWAVASAAVIGGATLVWLAATVALTPGGAEAYVAGLRQHMAFIDERYSVTGRGPDALLNNLRELARFLGRALFAIAPLLAVPLLVGEVRRVELRDRRRAAFLLLWTLAPLPVNVLVHAGEYGYVFTMLPGLCIIAARGAIGLASALRVTRSVPWAAAAVVAANAGIFLFSDQQLSLRDVQRRDHGIADRVAAIAPVEPRERLLIVTAYDQVLIEELLPGRRIVAYLPDATPSLDVPLTCGASTCLVFAWDAHFRAGAEWRTVTLPRGGMLRTAEVPSGATLRIRDGLTLSIAR